MLSYEDVIRIFLRATERQEITAHPETWLNPESLDRSFECVCHLGSCEDLGHQATCTIQISWSPLDTSLSFDGPRGICEFFHEPNEICPHLHTEEVPPLALDLTYMLEVDGLSTTDVDFHSIMRALRLGASEFSSRSIETRTSMNLIDGDTDAVIDSITLVQHVELPLWNPESLTTPFQDIIEHQKISGPHSRRSSFLYDDEEDDTTYQEAWLPLLIDEAATDIKHMLEMLDNLSL